MLGVFVVGIAVAIALTMFKSGSQSSNRDQIVNDLNNIGAKALEYYRKPQALAGGGYTFMGFGLLSSDTGNANGSYLATETLPAGAAYVPGGTLSIPSPVQVMYIVGCGRQVGNDGVNMVKVFIRVTGDSAITTVLN